MIYKFNGYTPVIHESAFVHELAAVIGNAIIGEKVYIGPGAAIRGDWGEIIIKDGKFFPDNITINSILPERHVYRVQPFCQE